MNKTATKGITFRKNKCILLKIFKVEQYVIQFLPSQINVQLIHTFPTFKDYCSGSTLKNNSGSSKITHANCFMFERINISLVHMKHE